MLSKCTTIKYSFKPPASPGLAQAINNSLFPLSIWFYLLLLTFIIHCNIKYGDMWFAMYVLSYHMYEVWCMMYDVWCHTLSINVQVCLRDKSLFCRCLQNTRIYFPPTYPALTPLTIIFDFHCRQSAYQHILFGPNRIQNNMLWLWIEDQTWTSCTPSDIRNTFRCWYICPRTTLSKGH